MSHSSQEHPVSFRIDGVSKQMEQIDQRDQAYWNCEFTKVEWALLIAVVLITAALHLGPVLNSALAMPLIVALATLCFLYPMTGFFYIACAQFLPFPEGASANPAQLGVLIWAPVSLVRYRRLNLRGLLALLPVLPWLIWFTLTSGERVFWPTSEYAKAIAYSVIACQLANESRGQYLKCVMGLSFGALMIMAAYWCYQVGLPVQMSDWGGEREGFARMGSVRADAVMVWPALLIGVSGLLGTVIALMSRESRSPAPGWLLPLGGILFLAALPPMVATMTHGAYAGLVMVVAAVIWALHEAAKRGALSRRQVQQMKQWLGILSIVGCLLLVTDTFKVRSQVMALVNYYSGVSHDTGAAASRQSVWKDSINTILKYPVFGFVFSGGHEEITSEYASEGNYLSHNVFLDYGRYSGIPGMLFLAMFFFWPAVKMWRSSGRARFLPFLLVHFALLIFWMSLSFEFYKTFWGFWMLMALVAKRRESEVAWLRALARRRSREEPIPPAELVRNPQT